MGQTLSEPVTTKETSAESNEHMKVGTSAMQGWRINILFMLISITEAFFLSIGLSNHQQHHSNAHH